MQRVTHCVLVNENNILLLQKPRRNWWVAPGGKMEPGENIREAVVREYREETGVYLKNPKLKGVFTIIIEEDAKVVNEWMMFSFLATEFDGQNQDECEEGILRWHAIDEVKKLPMAEGDYHIIDYLLQGTEILHGTFVYTPDFELIRYRLNPS
ncbi:8-oxo-dGTP diphosphatase [Bacillus sp. AFS041924]|uniref:NUDIX hydrolase n=1 Tax=Bacillus sp. AFS041924 TaxID=2033503 RepID=UPI000BFDB0D9|nr:8-oxo-dGTP diphosphatase [Bacillus sp. AFS041924]PGS51997.1 NUDIX hydrolase [Bacillus sp. AFS041924]